MFIFAKYILFFLGEKTFIGRTPKNKNTMGCIILIPMPNAPIGLCFHDSNIHGIPTQTTIVRTLMKNLVKMPLH